MFRTACRLPGRRLVLQQYVSEQRCQTRSLSTSSPACSENVTSLLKTSETDPNNLSERHLGRFYTISDDLYKKLFDHTIHHGFPRQFRDQCKTLREACVMVRKPYLELKKLVGSVDLQKPVVRFAIYGNVGSGRSMVSSSMIHWGYVNGFLLVHFPWVPLWSAKVKELVVSTARPGMYDHTVDAVSWLTKFKTMNAELIEKLNLVTEKEYQWSKREMTPAGSSIIEIVEHGISRPAHATDCLAALLQEIKRNSSQQKCKTMVISDGANNLFHENPNIKNPTDKRRKPNWRETLPMSKISIFSHFKDFLKNDWSGGVIITVIDAKAVVTTHRDSDLPRYLLGKEGWEVLDPFVPIEVRNFSSQEIQTLIDYYLEKKWLTHPGAATEEGRLELEYVSTRNPAALVELCKSR